MNNAYKRYPQAILIRKFSYTFPYKNPFLTKVRLNIQENLFDLNIQNQTIGKFIIICKFFFTIL